MKRVSVWFTLLLSAAVLLSGCDSTVAGGKYVMANSDGPVTPYVVITGDSFHLDYFLLRGKYISGKYDVDGNLLILTSSDGTETYVFEINEDILTFKKYKSSEINAIVEIPNGAEFVLDEG